MLTLGDVEACPGLVEELRLIDTYATRESPLLIRGETSTARAILPRFCAPKDILEIFCPLMPSDSGALLGVVKQHAGLMRRAGLVAFVEVDHLSPEDQRLLAIVARDRVIDARGTRLAARLVCQFDPRRGSFPPFPGVFLEVDLPPLATRAEDASVLLSRLLKRLLGEAVRMDKLALEAVAEYTWPGDVAELAGRAEQIAARHADNPHTDVITVGQLGIPHVTAAQRRARTQASKGRTLSAIMDEYEHEVIQLLMTRFGGNKSQVARELGISRSYLIQKCQKYGV